MRNSQDIPPKCIDPKYLKQSCKKEYIYIYINREREREKSHILGENVREIEKLYKIS